MNGWGVDPNALENTIRSDIRALVELLTQHHTDIAKRLDAINGTVRQHSVDIATHTYELERLQYGVDTVTTDVSALKDDSAKLRTATKVAVAIVSALGTIAFAAFEILSRFQ